MPQRRKDSCSNREEKINSFRSSMGWRRKVRVIVAAVGGSRKKEGEDDGDDDCSHRLCYGFE